VSQPVRDVPKLEDPEEIAAQRKICKKLHVMDQSRTLSHL
jgi:hypothetical protein